MKKYIYLIFLSCLGWIGCSNDDNGNFDVEIDENMFSFETIKSETALTDNEAKNMLEYVLRELKLDK